ncbi:hypothetical protein ACFQZQ_03055 [Lysobacter koreensis]|uniref:Helix-turn-helix domain-containing protein n=1 Tax=Lysobacter koreensis TaxID=266122 RepID=A0ABW2YMA1_9GAMM
MTFGVSPIHGTAGIRARGKLHACGRHGKLTARQIADLAGVCVETIRARIKAGVVGPSLVAPAWDSKRGQVKAQCRRPALLTACKLARAFPDRVPNTREIQALQPMSRSSALRWQQGYRDALKVTA